jgi:putative transposase
MRADGGRLCVVVGVVSNCLPIANLPTRLAIEIAATKTRSRPAPTGFERTKMREPYTQLFLHCVWATWDRLPLISSEIEAALYKAIVAKAHELKCDVVAIGGTVDHVHLVVRFPTTLAVAALVKEVKGSSSHLMTHGVAPKQAFKWQGAYGAFTVSKSGVDTVADYIQHQKCHHAENIQIDDWERCETNDFD